MGEREVLLACECPDYASVAALGLAASASGVVRTKITPLLTVEELDDTIASITGHPELDGDVSIFSRGREAAVHEAPLATRVTGSAACRRLVVLATQLGFVWIHRHESANFL